VKAFPYRQLLVERVRHHALDWTIWHLLLLIAWPWLLLLVSPNWIYLNVGGYVDAWLYFGYFQNLRSYLQTYTDIQYYGSRLSWVVPGYLAYHLLPPLAANLILRLGVFYTTVLSTYGTLALTTQRRTALLIALLLGGYSYFLQAAGSDYVDGAGIAYLALCIFCLTSAARRPRGWLWLVGAGAAAAGLLGANLFLGLLLPGLGLYYLMLNRQRGLGALVLGIVPGALGMFGGMALLGLMNLVLGSEFWFLRTSLRFAAATLNLPSNPWISHRTDWPLAYPHLIWPNLMLLLAALYLFVPRLRARLAGYPQGVALLALYLATLLPMVAMQLRSATPVLQAFFYASYLIVPLFLALGVVLAPTLASLPRAQYSALLGAAAALTLLALLLRACGSNPPNAIGQALVLGLIAIAALIVAPKRSWPPLLLVVVLCAGTPHALNTVGALDYCRAVRPTQGQPAAMYRAVHEGIYALRELAPGRRPYFWYNRQEQPVYGFFSSAHLYTWNMVGDDFPSLAHPTDGQARLEQGQTVVLLSRQDDAPELARRVLSSQGWRTTSLGQRQIQQGDVGFTMTVFELSPLVLSADTPIALSFGTEGNPEHFMRQGWTEPTPQSTWTLGPQAEIELPFERAPTGDLQLSLTVSTSVAQFELPQPALNVRLSVNGTELERWQLTRAKPGGELTALIPAEVAGRAETLRIRLDIDRPYAPSELGVSIDSRPLGISVAALGISPVR
jgi:hypothetical protein